VRASISEMSTKYVHWPCPQVGPHSSELYNGTRKSYTLYYYNIGTSYLCMCVRYAHITIYIYIYLNIISCTGCVSFCRETGRVGTNREEFSIFLPDCSYNRVRLCTLQFPRSLIPRSFRSIVKRVKKKRQISSHFPRQPDRTLNVS